MRIGNILKNCKPKRNRYLQKIYRDNLIKKYNRCPITNTHYKLCEACHILPYSNSKKKEKFDVNNGILLSSTLHKAFDRNYFTIDEKTCKTKIIEKNIIKDDIDKDEIKKLIKENKYIKEVDNKKSKYYLKNRNKN